MLTLYYSPGACSFASHVTLRELGIGFRLKKVEIAKGQTQQPEFIEINPRARVPVLSNGDWRLTESIAILTWLCDQKPESGLLPPTGNLERYRVLEWLSYLSSTLHPLYWGIWAPHRLSSDPGTHNAIRRTCEQALINHYRTIDAYLHERTFMVGEQLTIADVYVFVFGRWGRVLSEKPSSMPSLRRHLEKLSEIPSIEEAYAAEQLPSFL